MAPRGSDDQTDRLLLLNNTTIHHPRQRQHDQRRQQRQQQQQQHSVAAVLPTPPPPPTRLVPSTSLSSSSSSSSSLECSPASYHALSSSFSSFGCLDLSSSSPIQQQGRRRNQRQQRILKKVRFENDDDEDATKTRFTKKVMDHVMFVPKRQDMTEEERNDMWYTSKEYKTFKKSCKTAVDVIEKTNGTTATTTTNNKTATSSATTTTTASTGSLSSSCENNANTNSSSSSSTSICIRGVERMTREESTLYQQKRCKLLQELKFLQEEEYDSEELARVMAHATSASALQAREQGREDEAFAMEYLKDEIEMYRGKEYQQQQQQQQQRNVQHHSRRHSSGSLSMMMLMGNNSCSSINSYNNNNSKYPSLPILASSTPRDLCGISGSSTGIKSRRKMRAQTGRLFRQECARQWEGNMMLLSTNNNNNNSGISSKR